MPAPLTPDPAERPSDDPHSDPAWAHPLPTESDLEPPTVISSQRPRTAGFDPKIAEALAGRKLGPFELIEAVGAGGMAAVLRARDTDLGRVVALKILPPDMATDPENVDRFKQEARAAAKLDHDNVARVYHCGEDQGLHFIAFEFVEGDNLRQRMDAHGGHIPVGDAISLMIQVSAGLAHASERGVVHRDIKPSNIIVTPDGRAKIVDMGLARSMDARPSGQLTQSGVTLGTFDYISPEQAIDPRSADVRSDIYSLGCTFYHALTGQVPVPEGTAAAKLDAQKNFMPPDPRVFNAEVPTELAAILGRMLAKDPDRRYQHPDHLSAHLRDVARQVGLNVGSSITPRLANDGPLPPPPRLSAAWIATAVAVMALSIVIFTNAFHPAPTALKGWPEAKIATPPFDLVDPGPIDPAQAMAEPQSAENTTQLVKLLKQGAKNIKLTGPEYDLHKYRDEAGQPVEVEMVGDDVRLEGERSPTVRLGYAPEDGKTRSKTLTIRGLGAKAAAIVKNIRFVFPDPTGTEADAGLVVGGFTQLTVEDCTFTPTGGTTRKGPAALALKLSGALADLRRCYFGMGGVGVWLFGPGKVTADQCAMASHHAAARVSQDEFETGTTEITMMHCSTLLSGGAVVEVDDGVACQFRAGHCLFAGPTRYGPAARRDQPAVLRQKHRPRETNYRAAKPGREPLPNRYHNLFAYADGERDYSFAEAATARLPITDDDVSINHPWKSRDPFDLLDPSTNKPADPKGAFAPSEDLLELRIPNDPNVTFGTRWIGPEFLYPFPLSIPGKRTADPTVKVWDPEAASDADGTYRKLSVALAAVNRGDTLLIKYTGLLDVEPHEFKAEDTLLTIKPYPNSKPVLRPKKSFVKKEQGLFKLFNGKLVLDGLQFKLPADRPPAVVVLPGGGQVDLRNAVVTFEEGDDLSAIVVTDPRNEMMMAGTSPPKNWPVPKINLENVVLRGKGRMLSVKMSRPFELDVKNALAALDGTLIDIDPSSADPSIAGSGIVRLNRVTTYLGESLLNIEAADRKGDAASLGLAKTEVTATHCLFVPATHSREALVRAERFESDEQLGRVFTWHGRGNVYAYDKKRVLLEVRPLNLESMPTQTIDGDRWLGLTKEEGDPFAAEVIFPVQPPEAGQPKFAGIRPADFMLKRLLGLAEPADLSALGASSTLPVPFD